MSALRLAMVAGELSGDTLGAGLLRELKRRGIEVEAYGVGGPAMQAEGFHSWWQATEISVMGLTEVIRHLPRLLKLKKQLHEKINEFKPHAFIGIDLPDFNLRLATQLRNAEYVTIQYVSPTVWAWRPKRVKVIAQAVDLVLCLLPFEPAFYRQHNVAASFIGHPLADALTRQPDTLPARQRLSLPVAVPIVAILPGSRRNEVKTLSPIFLQAAKLVAKSLGEVKFVTAMASADAQQEWLAQCDQHTDTPEITICDAPAAEVIAASDVVLLASGTVALEALLVGRPMVVSYRLAALTAWLIKRFKLVKTRYFSLPNILANEAIVPELLQDEATPELIAKALLSEYGQRHDEKRQVTFERLREQLAVNADKRASDALLALLKQRGLFNA